MSRDSPRASAVVPSAVATSSVTCLESLHDQGLHTISVSERGEDPARYSKYCDEHLRVPSPEADLEAYKEALRSLAMRPDVRTILPLREEDIFVLSRYSPDFEPYIARTWVPFETMESAHDRVRLISEAREAGVTVPETTTLDQVAQWNRELIVKPRYALLADEYVEGRCAGGVSGTTGTHFFEPGADPDTEEITREMGHVPVVQEYVRGPQYSFRALYDEGKAVVTSQKRLVRGYQYARGPSAFHETVDLEDLHHAGTALLDALDWHGVASVQFIRDDQTGEFTLLEVNPRLWASLPLDSAAGVDYPARYWALAGGTPNESPQNYEVGIATHTLHGEIGHLYSVLGGDVEDAERPAVVTTVADILTSFVRHPRCDLLSFDDPRPFLRNMMNVYGPEVFSGPSSRTEANESDLEESTELDSGKGLTTKESATMNGE